MMPFWLLIIAATCFPFTAVAKVCTNITVPVNISARNGVFNVTQPQTNMDVTTFSLSYTNVAGNYTEEVLTEYATVTGRYNMSVKFCQPDNMPQNCPSVQVLTHGIGFDKTYWDLPYNHYNYSYINAATNAGFCTLSIDRLGIGNSSIADPINVIQAPAEVSALHQLNVMLREGTLPGVPHAFEKIVNVGHSFGSVQTVWLASLYPNCTDGIVLTGFSPNVSYWDATIGAWNLQIARLNSPLRFGNTKASDILDFILSSGLTDLLGGSNFPNSVPATDLPSGYLTWGNSEANQYAFLYAPYFDPAILPYAEATKQPVTIGELFTILGGPGGAAEFEGPVQIVTGEHDQIFCGGSCSTTGIPNVRSLLAPAVSSFPRASAFEAYVHPNTGHGINVHYNSTGAYQVINNFLIANGLGSS